MRGEETALEVVRAKLSDGQKWTLRRLARATRLRRPFVRRALAELGKADLLWIYRPEGSRITYHYRWKGKQ